MQIDYYMKIERSEIMKSKQTRAMVAGMLTAILLGTSWSQAASEAPGIKLQFQDNNLQVVTDADAPSYYLEYRTPEGTWQKWNAGQNIANAQALWFRAVFESGDIMLYQPPADVDTFYSPSLSLGAIDGQMTSTIGSIAADGSVVAMADQDWLESNYTPPSVVNDIPAPANNQAVATPMPGRSQLIWRNPNNLMVARWDLAETTGNEFVVRDYDQFRLLPDLNAVSLSSAWTLCGIASLDDDLEANDYIWQNTVSGSFALWRVNPDPTIEAYGTIKYEPTPGSGVWADVILPAPWKVVGIACLGNDGKKNDVIWQNPQTGLVALWQVGSDGRISSYSVIQYYDSVSLSWKNADLKAPWTLGAIGSFEGDGKLDDLIWHNPTTGRFAYWKLGANAQVTSFGLIEYQSSPGTWESVVLRSPWAIAGIAELDGDGKLNDVIWHQPTQGIVARWDVSATGQVTTYGRIKVQVSGEWQDIVLRAPWTMSGVVSVGSDNKLNSLVWHNPTSGMFACWRLVLAGEDTRISNYGGFLVDGADIRLSRPWEITKVRGN